MGGLAENISMPAARCGTLRGIAENRCAFVSRNVIGGTSSECERLVTQCCSRPALVVQGLTTACHSAFEQDQLRRARRDGSRRSTAYSATFRLWYPFENP